MDSGELKGDNAELPDSSSDDIFDEHNSRSSSPPTAYSGDDDALPSKKPRAIIEAGGRQRLKSRPSFRKPSTVRALQTDVTPPRLSRSQASDHVEHTPRSRDRTSKGMRKEYPLILLHVTVLPTTLHYSPHILDSILSSSELVRWRRLQDRATPTVLQRGMLIPHPSEDFDLLQERVLEALELRPPRILKCGHFDGPEDSGSEDDSQACDDCGGKIRRVDPETAVPRWQVKIYAANGLMQAPAWSAAWAEMERVDVEVLPGLSEETRQRLDLAQSAENSLRHEIGIGGLDDERLHEIYGHEETTWRELARPYLEGFVQDWRNIAIALLSLVVLFVSVKSMGSRSRGAVAVTPLLPAKDG